MDNQKRVPAKFFKTIDGKEPVREWLKSLPVDDRKIIGTDIQTVEYGFPIGMPTCRPMGKGLYEVRSNLSDSKIARVLFCIQDGYMVLLHGFIKKTQKTPKNDLDIANKRKKELENRQ